MKLPKVGQRLETHDGRAIVITGTGGEGSGAWVSATVERPGGGTYQATYSAAAWAAVERGAA